MACRTYTSSSSLEQIGSISRTQTTDNDNFCSREVGLHDGGESDSARRTRPRPPSDNFSPRLPKVFDFMSMGHNRSIASDRWDRIIPSLIQPLWSTSSLDLEAKGGGHSTGKWTRSQSAEELTPSKMHDVTSSHRHSSSLDDLSLMFPDQTWSMKRLRVRTRKPSTDRFQTPAPKRFTRIATQEVKEGTPASNHGIRRSHSLDWDEKTEDSGYCSPACPGELFPELPYKMGRVQMDIITAINQREPAIVDQILVYMTDEDVVRFSGVCQEWRGIIKRNRRTALQKKHFIQHKQKVSKKENYGKQNHQRNTVSASTPLREVQRVGQPLAASTPGPSTNTSDNYDKFIKASDSLFADESFTKCVRGDCLSPAKLLMNNQRATCTKCGYNFCTSCLNKFHGGSPCISLMKKNSAKKSHGVGSSKSKRSLKRIARLESYP